MVYFKHQVPNAITRSTACTLTLMALSLSFLGCTLSKPGVSQRLDRLVEYSSYKPMGAPFYSDRFYYGRGPIDETQDELRQVR